jgi:hypothetical protein
VLSTHDIPVYVIDILALDLYVFDVVPFSVMKLDYLSEVISEAIFWSYFGKEHTVGIHVPVLLNFFVILHCMAIVANCSNKIYNCTLPGN